MTDQEILEKAAKAAGLTGFEVKETPTLGLHVWAQSLFDERGSGVWNPLTDDGDALRLACKLKINIEHSETLSRIPHGVNCWPVGRGDCGHMENGISDYQAATRRAIVTAAAQLGESMP